MSCEAAIACMRAMNDVVNSWSELEFAAVCRAIASILAIEFLMRCFISCSIRSRSLSDFSTDMRSVVSVAWARACNLTT